MKKILSLFVGALAFFSLSFSVSAEVIKNFDVDLTLNQDGSLDVVEKILYDFTYVGEHHGIYRNIPISYGDLGSEVVVNLEVLSVTDEDGEVYNYADVSNGYEYVALKIGDAETFLVGEKWYYIHYVMDGVATGFEDHDEIYWNVTGNDWDVVIENASVNLTVPRGGNGFSKADCYTGYFGSEMSECLYSSSSVGTFNYSTTDWLYAGEGFTIVAGFSKGLVDMPTLLRIDADPSFLEMKIDGEDFGYAWGTMKVPSGEHVLSFEKDFRYKPFETTMNLEKGAINKITVTLEESILGVFFMRIFPVIIFMLGLFAIFMLWYKKGKDPEGRGTVMPYYKPPAEDLTPGEVGVLFDEKAHLHDITATIIDLAIKGFLKIKKEVTEKKWFLGSKKEDYTFVKKKVDYKGLTIFEVGVLNAVFPGDVKSKKLSELSQKFYKKLPSIKTALYEYVVSRGYFVKNPDDVRINYFVIGVSVLVATIIGTVVAIGLTDSFLYLGMPLLAVLFVGVSFLMPKKTKAGVEMHEKLLGYKMFLETAEKDRLKVLFSPKDYREVFEKGLPYAMVFGVEREWASEFDGLYEGTPDWYQGHGKNNNFSDFVVDLWLLNNMSQMTFVSTPQSKGGSWGSGSSGGWSGSSGFGGFSGGGFGGGGGGSW